MKLNLFRGDNLEIKEQSLIDFVLKGAGDNSIKNFISLSKINHAISSTIDEAFNRSLKVSFSIVDQEGNLIYFYRMPGAILVSLDLSQKKAYSAVAMNESTKNLYSKCQPGKLLYNLEAMTNGKIITFGGGIPIRMNDCLVGGLGISGAPNPNQDSELAEYCLKRLV